MSLQKPDPSMKTRIATETQKKCNCSYDKCYQFRHDCILKVINLSDISEWFFNHDQIENYSAKLSVAELIIKCMLDRNFDPIEEILLLETGYSIDLTGLDQIISDYREWN